MVFIWVWEPESLGDYETRADILVYRAAAHRAGSTTAYAGHKLTRAALFIRPLRAVMLYPVTGRHLEHLGNFVFPASVVITALQLA